MTRADLSSLLETLSHQTSALPADSETASHDRENLPDRSAEAPAAPAEPVANNPTRLERPPASSSSYLGFTRKETRLRADQLNALTKHARRLNQIRPAGSPRITDNTLIRVAIDLFLARADTAVGADENAIRKSLNR